MYTGEDGGNVIRRTPSILEDVKAQLATGINVGMEHGADEFDSWWFVRVGLFELHHQAEGTVFEGRVGRTNYDCIPVSKLLF